ncbi:MAG: hypothetical protein KKB90_11390 [Actinobacteria bacterium]|nr:hypothetical protein [Actinomycetota bacterium]MCG2820242.1 hypothetical protein [Actinomycetes bacterium]MBU4180030.1 hypothetical protein [Actinomycetota bacterium]MBU4219549.1 hypothetical protein [Actinomycetota bacterium]MBU4358117.1 hypothetical protein [Actinomycetota bacterium]
MSQNEDVRRPEDSVEAGVGARVIREIIRTPVFLEMIKAGADQRNPDAARQMVQTLLWEDASLSLGLMGASPAVMNYIIEALLEIGRQLNEFPDAILSEFLSQMAGDVSSGRLRELPEVYGPLLERIVLSNPEMREKLIAWFINGLNGAIRASVEVMAGIEEAGAAAPVAGRPSLDAAALGEAVTSAARLVNRQASGSTQFLKEVALNVDMREVAMAAASVGRSLVMTMLWMIGRLAGSLIKGLTELIGR